MAELTPLMRQYWEIKSLHQDKILLFRMGDFFEMFFDDAVTAAPILGIALTSRNKKSLDETPMCGMPYHSVATPINKLLAQGLKVAICDQVEDPKLAKGIVKRAVTRVLTPGMVLDAETLETTRSHYLACSEENTLACVDVTTGESFFFDSLSGIEMKRLISLLPIAEWIEKPQAQNSETLEPATLNLAPMGVVQSPCDALADASDALFTELGANPTPPLAARRLLAYIRNLGGSETQLILKSFERRVLQGRMGLSPTVLRHLEIFSNYKGDLNGTFFGAINRTQTSTGARLLRQWISFPLLDQTQIEIRLDQVENWARDLGRLQSIRTCLRGMGDLERRLSKIGQPSCNGRDLLGLRDSTRAGVEALELAGLKKHSFVDLSTVAQLAEEISLEIDRTLIDEPPLQIRQGHMIRSGYSPELDELILLSTDSHSLLEQMEARERQATGITSLKIRYNQVFGYYIEITNTHKDKAPSHYMRKQTLTNAERYCTDELVELEKKVLSAQARRSDLEFEVFDRLRKKVLAASTVFLKLAAKVAELDVETSLAWLSVERRYCRPRFSKDQGLRLSASRHPVVEQVVKEFTPNRIEISCGGCLLLTGPNMAGKSTLMRQVALTALLAQIGSFVPAEEAVLPLFDQIFTRIGASDQLTEGLSTFMVEMTETAEILKGMTSRSLVIFDEIGRGTSTFDGMSLAQSILEFLVGKKRAMTLFATHYHELTRLEATAPTLQNVHMSVVEQNGEIRFLHTLTKGPALKSYGIQVAKLAGLPVEVTKRAGEVLKKIENPTVTTSQLSLFEQLTFDRSVDESTEEALEEAAEDAIEESTAITLPLHTHPLAAPLIPWKDVLEGIRKWPLQVKTPLEALNQIAQWQNMISSQSSDLNH